MTQPDYPMLVLPGYELYQLAHIATYLADALARRRTSGSDVAARAAAERDVTGARVAWGRAAGSLRPAPVPIDSGLYSAVEQLPADGARWARAASLAPLGQEGWAVVGLVPGVGPVGARTPDEETAHALRRHMLTQPAVELRAWAVTDEAVTLPPPGGPADLVAVTGALDPARVRDQVVARHLRGADPQADAAIQRRFRAVDLDGPLVSAPHPRPPASTTPPVAGPQRRPAPRPRPQPPARSAAQLPTTRPGP